MIPIGLYCFQRLNIFTQTFIREYFRLQDRIKHSTMKIFIVIKFHLRFNKIFSEFSKYFQTPELLDYFKDYGNLLAGYILTFDRIESIKIFMSDQCTSGHICCDRGRSSPSCAQSKTPHRSPLAHLP